LRAAATTVARRHFLRDVAKLLGYTKATLP
jgi:hypothetical protein